MDEPAFWQLLATCRAENGGGQVLANSLAQRLRTLQPDEVLGFEVHWDMARERLYTWPVWDAACVLLGWVGDDSFRDVRAWIVSHGPETVARIAADADSLIELVSDRDNAFVEAFDGLVYKAHYGRTGEEPPAIGEPGRLDPTGDRINLKDAAAVRAQFPRLAAWRAEQPADAVDAGASAIVPDPVERCPRCGEAPTRRSYNTMAVNEGVPGPQIKYRRCVSCSGIAVRTCSTAAWEAVDEAAVSSEVVFFTSLL